MEITIERNRLIKIIDEIVILNEIPKEILQIIVEYDHCLCYEKCALPVPYHINNWLKYISTKYITKYITKYAYVYQNVSIPTSHINFKTWRKKNIYDPIYPGHPTYPEHSALITESHPGHIIKYPIPLEQHDDNIIITKFKKRDKCVYYIHFKYHDRRESYWCHIIPEFNMHIIFVSIGEYYYCCHLY